MFGVGILLLAGCTIEPKPITDKERGAQAQADIKAMFADQEPLTHPLTLQEAYARALKYNLERRVKLMEVAVAYDGLNVSSLDMLPKLTADAGYLTRSNTLAQSSIAYATGVESLVPSYSSDNNHAVADLTMSWNVLDFGVSYFTARQNADRVLIAEEHRRKVAENLVQQVRSAFWRAAAAQSLRAKIDDTIAAAERALDQSRKVETQALRPPLDALRYQRTLLDMLRQLEYIRDQLMTAETDLASLINLPPGSKLALAVPGPANMTYQPLTESIARMEQVAMLRNPDLREQAYQERINVNDVHKAILRLLPGISFDYGPQFDTDSFFVHNFWGEGAARISWNLFYVLYLPRTMRQTDDAVELAVAQRQAVAMAVLTQLHLAYQQYVAAGSEYARIHDLADVDDRIYLQVSNAATAAAGSDLEKIAAEVESVYSDLRRYESYSDLQAALGRLFDTMGLDVEAGGPANVTVTTLAHETDAIMTNWRKGGAGPEPTKPPTDVPRRPALPQSMTKDGGVLGAIERAVRDTPGP